MSLPKGPQHRGRTGAFLRIEMHKSVCVFKVQKLIHMRGKNDTTEQHGNTDNSILDTDERVAFWGETHCLNQNKLQMDFF